jgi:hypothetical protein
MLAHDGSMNGPDPIEQSDWDSAHQTSKDLHQLALRYWTEGRVEDAARVATEAGRILHEVDPHSELMAKITSTLQSLQQAASGPPPT